MSNSKGKSLSMLNVIGLKESINDLMTKESSYVPVASVCKAYQKKLGEGKHEVELYEGFISELSKVAVHQAVKDTISSINSSVNEHKRDIAVMKALFEMKNSQSAYLVPMLESSISEYLSNKSQETRSAARKELNLFEGIDQVHAIMENLSIDEYEEKTGNKLASVTLNESFIPQTPKTYSQEEVDAMVNEAKKTAVNEAALIKEEKKTISSVDTHIDLDSTIKKILVKEGRNDALKAVCQRYTEALSAGKPQELLYESFLSSLSNWNYLNAVDTEMSAMAERVKKYKQDIDLKKILETMKQTGSYYLVPLIEGVVVDFINNKNMTTKAILKQRLNAFEYDPFVRDILNVVMHDQSIEANVYLGESIENLNSYVHTEKIFSPVLYIKENECIFNVKGIYYNKKGNTITKLAKPSVEALDESFKMLCNLINHPAVSIDELSDTISIYEGTDSAKISESEILVNGNAVTVDELRSIALRSHLMNEHKEGFYKAIEMINEKFDTIAYLDFVKRVAMNESTGRTVDVFKIKDKLFITTIDEAMGSVVFYRNVNPIQCKNCINEHMLINVSPLFEDILPGQKALLEGIEETKKEYEAYIEKLNGYINDLNGMKDEADDTSKIDDAIDAAKKELEEVTDNYKKYQEETDKFLNGDPADKTTDSATPGDEGAGDGEGDAGAGEGGEGNETQADMEEPITTDPDIASAATGIEAENNMINNASEFDADFDVFGGTGEGDKGDVQVLRVSYEENIKNGKKENKGTVFVVIPSVNANGDIKDDTRTISFYLDNDHRPILNNEYMPLSIYNAIVDAIVKDPVTSTVETTVSADAAVDSLSADGTTPEGNTDIVPSSVADASTADTTGADAGLDAGLDASLGGDVPPVPDSSASVSDATPTAAGTDIDAPATDAGAQVNDTPAPSQPADSSTVDADLNTPLGTGTDSSLGGDTVSAAAAIDSLGDDDPANQETPAETQDSQDDALYPIDLGLNLDDIKPLDGEDFRDAMDDLGIEHSEVEGAENTICLKITDKSCAHALKKYFKTWKNFTNAEFINFFPELKKCFDNQSSTIPVMAEGVQIKAIAPLNESVLYNENKSGGLTLTLPYNEDYAKMFGHSKGASVIEIVTENVKESEDLYRKISLYAQTKGDALDESAKVFLAKYKKDFEDVVNEQTYNVSVPYSGFLAQKLALNKVMFTETEDKLNIAIPQADYGKVRKIFEGFYQENTPVEVKSFFQESDGSLKEGLSITIRDTNSGKEVTLDTDDIMGDEGKKEGKGGEAGDAGSADFSSSFKDTTFNPEDSVLFKEAGGEDADGDSSDDKDDNKEDKGSDDKGEESKEGEDNEDKGEKKKVKFTFKKKKNESAAPAPASEGTKVNEGAQTEPAKDNKLNEGAEPNVGDYVILNGAEGYVISKMPMTNEFIVNVGGHTVTAAPSSLKLATAKRDDLPVPFKFDETTLKLLFEQMVHCGMFMNETCLTPKDCFVKYSEYINAEDDDKIRLVVEGENLLVDKKLVRVTDDINEFANLNDYVRGNFLSEGQKPVEVALNIKDYRKATNQMSPVRVILGESLKTMPAGSLEVIEK